MRKNRKLTIYALTQSTAESRVNQPFTVLVDCRSARRMIGGLDRRAARTVPGHRKDLSIDRRLMLTYTRCVKLVRLC